MSPSSLHIIIIGAGITGSSIAYHLVRQQARVTLIDHSFGTGETVTENSFAWLTAGNPVPESYYQFKQQGIADWHRVVHEFNGRLKVDRQGALMWYRNDSETERIAGELQQHGHPAHLIDRQQISALEPHLKQVPGCALFAAGEGAIDPVLTTNLFIQAARERGADVRLGTKVLSLLTHDSRITGVVTAHETLAADWVIMASGTHTAELCHPLDLHLPISSSPAILMQFENKRRFVNRIVSNPLMELRPASDTLIVAAEDYIDESAANNPQAIAQRTLARIKAHWQGTEQLRLMKVSVGKRPVPQDGLPVIGRVPGYQGLYVAVMHTGVTLAALIGRFIAEEMINNQSISALSPYRPERFAAY